MGTIKGNTRCLDHSSCRVQGLGLSVWGFRVWDLGFKGWGLGCKELGFKV